MAVLSVRIALAVFTERTCLSNPATVDQSVSVSVCDTVILSVSVCETVSVFYIVPNPRKYTECMPSTPVRSRDCVTASTYVTLDGGHSNTEHWELPSEL